MSKKFLSMAGVCFIGSRGPLRKWQGRSGTVPGCEICQSSGPTAHRNGPFAEHGRLRFQCRSIIPIGAGNSLVSPSKSILHNHRPAQ
jgi:hypothetical protein